VVTGGHFTKVIQVTKFAYTRTAFREHYGILPIAGPGLVAGSS